VAVFGSGEQRMVGGVGSRAVLHLHALSASCRLRATATAIAGLLPPKLAPSPTGNSASNHHYNPRSHAIDRVRINHWVGLHLVRSIFHGNLKRCLMGICH
jgi:hypothetical protein